MGFVKRLRGGSGERSQALDALALHAGGMLSVVGESRRQDALARVARNATGPEPYLAELKGRARGAAREEGRLWFRAALLREPDNPYDENAIAVHATGVGLIGYLDRETALDYAPVFEELAQQGCSVGACPAMLIGGGEGKSWGAVLCLSSPDAVIGDLRSPPSE
jgi:HIRAN domain